MCAHRDTDPRRTWSWIRGLGNKRRNQLNSHSGSLLVHASSKPNDSSRQWRGWEGQGLSASSVSIARLPVRLDVRLWLYGLRSQPWTRLFEPSSSCSCSISTHGVRRMMAWANQHAMREEEAHASPPMEAQAQAARRRARALSDVRRLAINGGGCRALWVLGGGWWGAHCGWWVVGSG